MESDDVVYLKNLLAPTEPIEEEVACESFLTEHGFASELKLLQAAIGIGDYSYSIGIQTDSGNTPGEWLSCQGHCLPSHPSPLLESVRPFVEVKCRKAPIISATAPLNWEKTEDHIWIFSPSPGFGVPVSLLPRDELELQAIVGSCVKAQRLNPEGDDIQQCYGTFGLVLTVDSVPDESETFWALNSGHLFTNTFVNGDM